MPELLQIIIIVIINDDDYDHHVRHSSDAFTVVLAIYTGGHKKRANLFGIITPMFRGGFYTSCTNGNRKKYTLSGNYKICNYTTIVSLHYLRKFKNTEQHILKPLSVVFNKNFVFETQH